MAGKKHGSQSDAATLAAEIKAAGLARKDVAALIGVQDDTLKRWLRGTPQAPPHWALELLRYKLGDLRRAKRRALRAARVRNARG